MTGMRKNDELWVGTYYDKDGKTVLGKWGNGKEVYR